ncbi:unnamed protein product [Trichobilharzia szidati]|nr:unnamed protein product [Trichobilharzia szidati]
MGKKLEISKTPEEKLTENEMTINEYILNSSDKTTDTIFHALCECLALSRIIYGEKDWHNAQYYCCLGYFYITYKGHKYALQAESHAEKAVKLLSHSLNSVSEESTNDYHSNNNFIISCLILLSYYTLAKSKSIQQKKKEALSLINQTEKALCKAEKQFDLIQNAKHFTGSLDDHNKTSEDSKKILDDYYEQWDHCTLLRLDKNFFPNLYRLKLRIYNLHGKIACENEKFDLSHENYLKALKLIEEKYDAESKETILIYQALGRIEEYRKGDDYGDKAISYFQKAYEISKRIFNEKSDVQNLLELMRSVYILCTVCVKLNSKMNKVEELLGETLQAIATFSVTNNQQSNDNLTDNVITESMDLSPTTDESLLNHHDSTDQFVNINNKYSSETVINLTCTLRSLLVKIYIKQNRFQEALYLLQENLNIQEDIYGMYNADVIKTRQLILSIHMVQGNFSEAVSQAELCLSLEEFTFGVKSKQVKKTKEILEALSSYKKSGQISSSTH